MFHANYKLLTKVKLMLKKNTILFLLLTVVLPTYATSTKDPERFTRGEHFEILRFTQAKHKDKMHLLKEESPKDHNKPQLIMFFNYGCYGCWLVNKKIHLLQQSHKKKLTFLMIPVAFNPTWENLAKVYYLNQQLKPNYKDEDLFKQIHEFHNRIWLEKELTTLYAAKNIQKQNILQLYHSFDVARKVEKAKLIADTYGIKVTPNFILNIKQSSYRINFTMVHDIETLFKIIDYLINNQPD